MANDYPRGTIKQDPETYTVAVRSEAPDASRDAWMCGHPEYGGHWASSADVEDWVLVPGTPVEAPESEEPEETEETEAPPADEAPMPE